MLLVDLLARYARVSADMTARDAEALAAAGARMTRAGRSPTTVRSRR